MLLVNFRKIMQAPFGYLNQEIPGPNPSAKCRLAYSWSLANNLNATNTAGGNAYSTYKYNQNAPQSLFNNKPGESNNSSGTRFQIVLSTETGTNVNDTALTAYKELSMLMNTCREWDYGRQVVTTTTFELAPAETEPVVVKQIGLMAYHLANTTDFYNACLLAKTDLDEPVTFNPGDKKSFTYTIDFAQLVDNAVQNT